MSILVSGLLNIETNLKIDDFPYDYTPINFSFFGVKSSVSGVGYNIAKALNTLGQEVKLISIIGKDILGKTIEAEIQAQGISTEYLSKSIEENPQTVILYDKTGRRSLNTDLKDIQESQVHEEIFLPALEACSTAVLCNINFSRKYLKKAKALGKLIATDVHVISDLKDEYNKDFMSNADILFMSDERLPCEPEEWAKKVMDTYGNEIVVIGMGSKGSLMAVKKDNFIERIPAYYTRPVINTVGAGDSFFSSFIYEYNKYKNPYDAIKKASVFASYKIGEKTASEGFLKEGELEAWCKEVL
ncbi:MAG: carbohydrate kinase family protein [Bacillota bacterium]|nr:carbohydrate kinase family protein [Bacillota bacterium]